MKVGSYDPEQVWRTETADAEQSKTTTSRVLAACAAGFLLSGITGFLIGHQPVDGLAGDLAQAQFQLNSKQVTIAQLQWNRDHCVPDGTNVPQIQQMIAKGAYREAAAVAELALTSSSNHFCPGSALPALWYTASLDALFSTPVTSPLDDTPVLTWQGIEQRASLLGLGDGQRVSPLVVFTYAYNNQDWQLARAAFLVAFRQRLVAVTDLVQLDKYYAVLRNEGHTLAFTQSGHARSVGLQLLATASDISRAAGLNRGEAYADLVATLGTTSAKRMVADPNDPILVALSHR